MLQKRNPWKYHRAIENVKKKKKIEISQNYQISYKITSHSLNGRVGIILQPSVGQIEEQGSTSNTSYWRRSQAYCVPFFAVSPWLRIQPRSSRLRGPGSAGLGLSSKEEDRPPSVSPEKSAALAQWSRSSAENPHEFEEILSSQQLLYYWWHCPPLKRV